MLLANISDTTYEWTEPWEQIDFIKFNTDWSEIYSDEVNVYLENWFEICNHANYYKEIKTINKKWEEIITVERVFIPDEI